MSIIGDRWILRGPREYIPPTETEVLLRRKAIPLGMLAVFDLLHMCYVLILDENEGIYVRDIKSGRVRAVVGKTYMLTENEELWEKELPSRIEQFLRRDLLAERYVKGKDADAKTTTVSSQMAKRDKWKLVTYRVPQNEAVQVYDYKAKQSRIIFGPELVMLGPDEHFTYINASGSIGIALLLLVFLSLFFFYKKFTSNKKVLFFSVFVLLCWFCLRRFLQ